MDLTLSVPSKTFLCGEYLALQGGPCILIATEPRFTLRVSVKGPSKISQESEEPSPFHPESPAGLFLKSHPELLAQYNFEFGRAPAGFGGSSAEFLLLSAFEQLKSPLTTEAQLDLDIKKTLSDYGQIFEGQAQKPSGADMVGQAQGLITAFHRKAGRIQNFTWDFGNLGFLIFRTGRKLATHDHLKTLKPETFEDLEASCHQVWEALSNSIENHLIVGLVEFTRLLERKGLQDPETLKVTQKLRALAGVRVAKGSGAMGTDAVLVIYDRREVSSKELIPKAQDQGLEFFADEKSLTRGLRKDHFKGAQP